MKKNHCLFILYLFVLNFIIPQASAVEYRKPCCPFSGFHASLSAGLAIPQISFSGTILNSIPATLQTTFTSSRKITNTAFEGNARLGYDHLFSNCFVAGLSANFTFIDNHIKFGSELSESGSDLLIPIQNSIKVFNQYALLAKIGRKIGTAGLFYGLIGPLWGKFALESDISYQQNLGQLIEANLSAYKRLYQTGLLLGLGAEFILSRCISLSLEYTHTNFNRLPTIKQEAPVTADGVIIPDASFSFTGKTKVQCNNVQLSLGYYF